MTYPVFTATANAYSLGLTTSSANITMEKQSVTPNTVIKADNAGPNIAYITFSTVQIGNVNHPTTGTANSAATIPVLPSTTAYLNPNLGTYTGNIVVSGICAAGTSTVLLTTGV